MKAAELEALGRRAVTCPRRKWLPGMAVLRYAPGTPSHGQRKARVDDEFVTYEQALSVHIMPDLSDPATLDCLLALVREAHGDPSFVVRCVAGLWYEESSKRALVARGSDTEAEALVAALEVAP